MSAVSGKIEKILGPGSYFSVIETLLGKTTNLVTRQLTLTRCCSSTSLKQHTNSHRRQTNKNHTRRLQESAEKISRYCRWHTICCGIHAFRYSKNALTSKRNLPSYAYFRLSKDCSCDVRASHTRKLNKERECLGMFSPKANCIRRTLTICGDFGMQDSQIFSGKSKAKTM